MKKEMSEDSCEELKRTMIYNRNNAGKTSV